MSDYDWQRRYAKEFFPFLVPKIEEGACFEDLFHALSEDDKTVILMCWDATFPSEWAYRWARRLGDREIMLDRVTDSEWAYWWARRLGDREIMRDRVTEARWAYRWAYEIEDRAIASDHITGS